MLAGEDGAEERLVEPDAAGDLVHEPLDGVVRRSAHGRIEFLFQDQQVSDLVPTSKEPPSRLFSPAVDHGDVLVA